MLKKTLESPLDCKKTQPVYPKGDSPECSLEELMLKLKLQYFCHLMWRADVFELVCKTLESPLDSNEIKPVNPKRNQPWIFIGRTDAEAEAAILWPPDTKSWLIRKDPDAGKDWGQEEKGMTEVGWHHQLNGHGFGWTLRVGWTGRPCVVWFMGSQRVGHDWVTELKVKFNRSLLKYF